VNRKQFTIPVIAGIGAYAIVVASLSFIAHSFDKSGRYDTAITSACIVLAIVGAAFVARKLNSGKTK